MANATQLVQHWLMLLALAASLTGCGCNHQPPQSKSLEKVEILIDWEAAPTYVGVYYALDSGLFAKAGYDVTIIETWGANQAANAVASGKYDISTCAGGATVLAIDQEKPIVSTAVICPRITTVIYGLASNGITKPEDLKGKRLGMYAGSITVNEFRAFAKLHSLDRREIKETIISGGDIAPLKSGVLDAVLNYQEQSPTLLSLDKELPEVKGQRVNSISLADAGVKGYGLNVIAGKQALAKNPEKVAALTKAIVGGYRSACENPVEAVDSFMKRFPNRDRAFVRAGWEVMRKHVGDTHAIGTQTTEGWDDTVALYRSLGLLKRDFSGADVMKTP